MNRKIEFTPKGTCSRKIVFELDGDVVRSVQFLGGCTGNLHALARLSQGRKAQELIDLLAGIQCQNGTSCPDQLASALRGSLRSES